MYWTLFPPLEDFKFCDSNFISTTKHFVSELFLDKTHKAQLVGHCLSIPEIMGEVIDRFFFS